MRESGADKWRHKLELDLEELGSFWSSARMQALDRNPPFPEFSRDAVAHKDFPRLRFIAKNTN
jgi:hypothetical protein